MSNPNPSPGTRWQHGSSGNPAGSSKRARAAAKLVEVDMLELLEEHLAAVDQETKQSAAAAIVTALLEQARAGNIQAIIHVLNRKHGKVRTATEQHEFEERIAQGQRDQAEQERERAEAEQMAAADLAAVEGLLAEWPAMTRETAEEFVADLHAAVTERLPKESLTEQLRRHLLGLPEPRLTAAEKDAVIREMYGKYGLDYELGPEPDPPPPRCGLVELPAPQGEPPPPPPPRTPVVTPEQEARELAERDRAERERQEQERQVVWFGDLAIFPGLKE